MTPLLLITTITTALFLWCAVAGSAPLLHLFSNLFRLLVLSIALVSFTGIVLLEFGVFSAPNVLYVELAVLLAALTVSHLRGVRPVMPKGITFRRRHALLLLVLAVATYFRLPVVNCVAGGQDQGIYVNVANHVARTGSVFVQDPVLEWLADHQIWKDYYLTKTYRSYKRNSAGTWSGAFKPGIYVEDLDIGRLTPQFYHLHPLWFGISSALFGSAYTVYPLFVFSLLCIVAVYGIARVLFRSDAVAVLSALILAVNPAHSYFGRFPVSEETASFFFLAGLYCYLASRGREAFDLLLSALAFGGLFFTRITGFVFLPLLLVFVLFRILRESNERVRRHQVGYFFGLLGLYIWSYFHGLYYSHGYSAHIYQLHLGASGDVIREGLLFFAVIVPALCVVFFSFWRYRNALRKGLVWLARQRVWFARLIMLGVFGLIVYKGYILAFTDTYADHVWLAKKWRIADRGLESLWRFNIVVLARVFSTAGVLLALVGLYRVLRKSFVLPQYTMLGIFAFTFFFLLTVVQNNTPYLYYYSRYMVSELMPLFSILAASTLIALCQKLRSAKSRIAAFAVGAVALFLPLANYSFAHVSNADLDGYHDALGQVVAKFPDNAMLLIDAKRFPVIQIETALRLTFGLPTMNIRIEHFPDDGIRYLASYFAKQGREVFLLTTQAYWRNKQYLEGRGKVIVPEVMLTRSAGQRLPTRYKKLRWHVGVYQFVEKNLGQGK